MTSLKPCPFCGGDAADPSQVEYGDCHVTYCYCIVCMECEAYMEMDTREEVVSAWNKRVATGGKVDMPPPDWFKQKTVDDTETGTVHRFIGG